MLFGPDALSRTPLSFSPLSVSGTPPGLLPAREQMAVSLGWHIILACFGVAFPTMIYVVHRRGLRRGDSVALGLARRWSKAAAVLFAIGAVSGTVLSFEMGLLWPGLMGRFGDVLGLPFAFKASRSSPRRSSSESTSTAGTGCRPAGTSRCRFRWASPGSSARSA